MSDQVTSNVPRVAASSGGKRTATSSSARTARSQAPPQAAARRALHQLSRLPSRQPACPVTTNVAVAASSHDVAVEASGICDSAHTSKAKEVPFYLRRQRFHGFRDEALLPQRGSLANLDVNERILLKKRLLQHRLQEMIHRLQSERPEKITGVLAAKINYLKELATRP